jgi:hypothetical protein
LVFFETTVGTSGDQTAIAAEAMENGRNLFIIRWIKKMLNFIYNSAKYEVKRDKWKKYQY